MEASIFVVILNYNHLDDLKETINSFERQDYTNVQIVVSDNGSVDQSVHWLKSQKPNIHIIENGKNLGWADGNNVGIEFALEKQAGYILLANNDLAFDDESILKNLVNKIEDFGNCIIGVEQRFYSDRSKVFNRGRVLLNSKQIFNRCRANYVTNYKDAFRVVDYVPGSFLLANKDVFELVGSIESDFFLYSEDADFGLRAWKKGFPSLVDTSISIQHKVSATSGNYSKLKVYYQVRNFWLLYARHNDVFLLKHRFLLIWSYREIKLLLKLLTKRKYRIIPTFFIANFHGMMRKYGTRNF